MASTATKSSSGKGGGGGKDAAAEDAPQKKGKKKLLAVVAVLAIAGGGAGYTFFGPGKSAEAAEKEPEPPAELGEVLVIDPISINLADGHYLKLGLGLQAVAEAEHAPEGSKALDSAIALYSGRTMEELSNPEERKKLQEELVKTVDEEYHHEVVDVYFREYVMQ